MKQKVQKNPMMEAQIQSTRYNGSRINLLLVVLFTVINMILLVSGSNSYYLFSASIPYTITDLARYLCGLYPPEAYAEAGIYAPQFSDISLFYIALAISIVVIGLYLLSFFLSKKQKVGWLIFALVFFVLDTAWLILYIGDILSILMDLLFHVWVIFSLSMGIYAYFKLRKLPKEMDHPMDPEAEAQRQDIPDSKVLRYADHTVKAKIFLEREIFGHKIVYRRVKKTNELVIDGKVYGEYTALFEAAHSIRAVVDGHSYGVGFDGKVMNYLIVDDSLATQKVRLS